MTRTKDLIFDKKLCEVTSDLKRYRVAQLNRIGEINSIFVVDFLYSNFREVYLKPASRSSTIDRLSQLSSYHKNKSFKKMTADDVFLYLDSIRRTESEDLLHRWIGTYNLSVVKDNIIFQMVVSF
jgi:hypothetical protein